MQPLDLIGWSCMFYFMTLSSGWHNYRKPNVVFKSSIFIFGLIGLALQTTGVVLCLL